MEGYHPTITGSCTWDTPLLKDTDVGFSLYDNTSEMANEASNIIIRDQNINKHNRNFLWEDNNARKKADQVNWDTVYKGKREGGLGIRRARENNLAFLSKLSWRIHNENYPLRIQLIRTKYLSNRSF